MPAYIFESKFSLLRMVLTFALGLFALPASGGAIQVVRLKTAPFSSGLVSVEIRGQFSNLCRYISHTYFDLDESEGGEAAVNVYVEIGQAKDRVDCHEMSVPFTKVIPLEEIANGFYILNVFEDRHIVFSTHFSVPLDIETFPMDFEIERRSDKRYAGR